MAEQLQSRRVSLQVLRDHWERAYGKAPGLVPTIHQKYCRTPEDQLSVSVPEAQRKGGWWEEKPAPRERGG